MVVKASKLTCKYLMNHQFLITFKPPAIGLLLSIQLFYKIGSCLNLPANSSIILSRCQPKFVLDLSQSRMRFCTSFCPKSYAILYQSNQMNFVQSCFKSRPKSILYTSSIHFANHNFVSFCESRCPDLSRFV